MTKFCVSLYEKLKIMAYQEEKELLNKRFEVICKCRHARKFLAQVMTLDY